MSKNIGSYEQREKAVAFVEMSRSIKEITDEANATICARCSDRGSCKRMICGVTRSNSSWPNDLIEHAAWRVEIVVIE